MTQKTHPHGLLWYDADPRTNLAQKVAPAVKRFIEKYGKVPDTVFVHPDTLPEPGGRLLGVVTIRGMRTVSPGYFFVVKDEKE